MKSCLLNASKSVKAQHSFSIYSLNFLCHRIHMKCGEKRTEQKKKDNKALLKIALCTHKKYDV